MGKKREMPTHHNIGRDSLQLRALFILEKVELQSVKKGISLKLDGRATKQRRATTPTKPIRVGEGGSSYFRKGIFNYQNWAA